MKVKDIELGDIAVANAGVALDPTELTQELVEANHGINCDANKDLSTEDLGHGPLFSSKLKGILLYNLSIACNSLMAATSKLAVETAGPTESVLIRQFPTMLAICAYMHLTRVPHNIVGSPEHRSLLLLRGVIGLVNILGMYYALQYLALPDVAALGVITPLVTVLLAACYLGESVVWQQYLCSVFSLVGVLIIARPPALFGVGSGGDAGALATSSHRSMAVLAALVAISGTGTVTIILRKLKSSHALQSVGMYALCSSIGATAAIFAGALLGKPVRFPGSWTTVAYIIGSGVFGFLFQAFQARALQLEEASKLVNFRYTSLIWAAAWEYLIWRDLPDKWTIIGSILVLGASVGGLGVNERRKPQTSM